MKRQSSRPDPYAQLIHVDALLFTLIFRGEGGGWEFVVFRRCVSDELSLLEKQGDFQSLHDAEERARGAVQRWWLELASPEE